VAIYGHKSNMEQEKCCICGYLGMQGFGMDLANITY